MSYYSAFQGEKPVVYVNMDVSKGHNAKQAAWQILHDVMHGI